jgi:hypothetical protein
LVVCSTTLWIGHLSKLIHESELSDVLGTYGEIVSIDLIPPRGCAFVCMLRRSDAHRAMQKLKDAKIGGKSITVSAWYYLYTTRVQTIDYGCEDGRILVSASCVTNLKLDSLTSSENGIILR